MCLLMKDQDRDSAEKVDQTDTLDLHTLATTLGRAFRNDPYFAWRIPSEERRRRLLYRLWRLALRLSRRHGEIYIAEDADSCALWIRPGHHIEFGRVVRPGTPTAHWYLMALGVGPA